MSASEDVKTLFRRFGGEPDSYQEVVRERQASQALGKWAMLGQVDLLHPQDVPGVHRAVKTGAVRPAVQDLQKPLRPVETQDIALPRTTAPTEKPKALHSPLPPGLPAPPPQPTPVVFAPPEPASSPKVTEAVTPRQAQTLQAHAISLPSQEGMVRAVRQSPPPVAQELAEVVNAHADGHATPLATRLKGYATPNPAPASKPAEQEEHTLSGLFDRLSNPSNPSQKTGVLRRKFNR